MSAPAFDALAPHYAGANGGLEAVYAAARPRLDELISGRDVLDVGGGGAAPYDAARAASLTALDLSAAMLARIPEGRSRKIVCDARDMAPFADASFDLVLFNLSLHHIVGSDAADTRDGSARALKEAWRVLRPGGDLLVYEPTVGAPLSRLQDALFPLLRRVLSVWGVAPVFLRTSADVAEAVAAAGGRAPAAVETTRLRPSGWADPLGGTFPGLLRLPLAWHPTRFELFRLGKPHE